MTLQALHDILASEGLAMSNVGSISDTSIAGVVCTGTHGSGMNYGCLSTHVLALEVILADGSRVRCSRSEEPDLFLATLCGLGTTGLIIRVTLQIERAFCLKEVRKVVHIDDVIRNIESISLSGEYVRAWWSPQTNLVSVMSSHRTIEVRSAPKSKASTRSILT
jgi:L-gulonolactone oxidase